MRCRIWRRAGRKFYLSHPHLEDLESEFLTTAHSIINTTSTVAFRGTGSMVDYAATKGAIVSFTRSLAQNLMSKGIRVNAVAPGPVHTPLQPASRPAEQMEGFGEKSGIGRIGQPSEIAPSFVFLACKDSELYYGQVLHAYPLGD
jgi:NAD(P)-dependent dehydrogenase (short-subunit alcohol dehydrogenase family)